MFSKLQLQFRPSSYSLLYHNRYFSSSSSTKSLSDRVTELVPKYQSDMKDLKLKYSEKKLGDTNIGQVLGGMRGMTGLFTETSLLDANEGITFRGYTIPQIQQKLPKFKNNGQEPQPEGKLHYIYLYSNYKYYY